MINRIFYLTLLCLLTTQFTFAQNRSCSTMDRLEVIVNENPTSIERMSQIESFTENYLSQNVQFRNSGTIVIPVVVHIVYKQNSQNISEAQILSQIDVLNEDFRRTNADANNTWGQAVDTEIEFCLATIDPSGNPTDGITRRKTNKQSFSYNNDGVKHQNLGGTNAWPTDQYLNMWVCNLGSGLLGYAQFPGSGNADEDGVVMGYQYFGRYPDNPFNNNFNLGRTATHEVGHWLNLRHIWGDGGCSVDDYVSDTPLSDAANYGCAVGHSSCGSTDMVQNYMDYSDDDCMNLFTAGQKARMLALFNPGGARESLLSSPGCGNSNVGPTCTDGIQNGNETGIDCGGDCAACPPTPTCNDGIQNGNETGVDCGGSCSACPPPAATCSDGIQNGNETGVDCGGTCSPCPQPGACDAPTNLYSQSKKGGKEAELTWNTVSSATSYEVRIRPEGSANWNSTTTTSSNIRATGLSRNSSYEWEVRAICGADASAWASSAFVAGQSGRFLDNVLAVYPNPASDYINIDFWGEWNTVNVYISDVSGKTIYQENNYLADQTGYLEISTNQFAEGIYFINVINAESGVVTVEKLIIAK